MRLLRARVLALLAFILVPSCLFAQEATGPELLLVGFSDDFSLTVDGAPVRLEEGFPGFDMPVGAQAEVMSGTALFLVEGTQVAVAAGDGFTYLVTDGRGQLLVRSGSPEVTAPNKARAEVNAGQSVPVTGPEAGVAPPPPPTREVERLASGAALPEAQQPAWDPLSALARATDRLSRLRQPKLRLVLEIHPYYTLKQIYDSNIYLVPPDGDDGTRVGGGVLGSWITENILGARCQLPVTKKHRFEASYSLRTLTYSNQPSANNALDQNAGANYGYTGRRGLIVKLWDKYMNVQDPAFSELVARERRYQNEAGLRGEQFFGRRFFAALEFRDTAHKYLDPGLAAQLNRFEASGGADLGLVLQPKTKLFVSYRREVIHYSAGRSNHSKGHRMGLGIDGKPSERLTLALKGDVQVRRYDDAPAESEDKEIRTFLTSLDAEYRPADRTQLKFRVFRSLNESISGGNRYYVSNGVSLSAIRQYRRLVATASGNFATDRYPKASTAGGLTANRRDDLYRAGLELEYRVRPWLSTGVSYERLQRHSIFTRQFNYKADRSAVQLKITF
ncbi:MAG: outer membrane beta-barrel protein [Elusimicrobiota bacterium]